VTLIESMLLRVSTVNELLDTDVEAARRELTYLIVEVNTLYHSLS